MDLRSALPSFLGGLVFTSLGKIADSRKVLFRYTGSCGILAATSSTPSRTEGWAGGAPPPSNLPGVDARFFKNLRSPADWNDSGVAVAGDRQWQAAAFGHRGFVRDEDGNGGDSVSEFACKPERHHAPVRRARRVHALLVNPKVERRPVCDLCRKPSLHLPSPVSPPSVRECCDARGAGRRLPEKRTLRSRR